MSATAAQQKYQELRNKIAEAKKTMEETAKGLFNEMSAELFSENPTLVSFGWTQYTPYFNDGDVCTFRCNSSYPAISMTVGNDVLGYDSNSDDLLLNGEEVRSSDDLVRQFKSMGMDVDSITRNGKQYVFDKATNTVTENGVKMPTYDDYHKMFTPLEKTVGAFLNNFEDEDMQVMFGDHVRVRVNRDGKIEVENHEHD